MTALVTAADLYYAAWAFALAGILWATVGAVRDAWREHTYGDRRSLRVHRARMGALRRLRR